MRRTPIAFWLLMLAACGGGDTVAPPTTVPPPPPPPGLGQVASLTVNSGQGQTTAPDSKVPVRPSVLVLEAGGRPVPGTSVTFAVDTGGGRVDGPIVQTGADGIATVGDWTLGSAEGVNRLRASAGTLPPVVFAATAQFPTTLLAEATIGANGGTLQYDKPGDPLHGLKLVIPSGAFPTAGQWKIESRPPATGPALVSGRIGLPILSITTDQELSDSALYLTLPFSIPADSFPTVFIRDPASGVMEALTPVSFTATTFTVAARHFAAPRLFGVPKPSAAPSASIFGTPKLINVVMIINASTFLPKGVSTSFLPGNDDWEFPNYGTYITPFGNRVGTSLSALFYFQSQPSVQAVGLWGKYDLGAFWADDPQGVRVSAVAESAIDWTVATKVALAIQSQAGAAVGSIDAAHLYTIAAAMIHTGQPQLIVGFGGALQGMYGLIAYKVDLNGITAVDPNQPGVPVHIPFANGKFQAVNLGPMAGAPTSQFFVAQTMGPSAVIDHSKLSKIFNDAAAGTAGAAEFPQYRLQYMDPETTLWQDLPTGPQPLQLTSQELQLRTICTACARAIPNGAAAGLQGLDIYNDQASLISSDRTVGFTRFVVPANGKVGIHVLGGLAPTGGATEWKHVDFKYITVKAARIVISPNPGATDVGAPTTLTAKNLDPGTPAGAIYEWEFGDGTTARVTGDSTVTKTWNTAGNFTVKVRLVTPGTQATYGRASSTVAVSTPLPVWRFTQWTWTHFSGAAATDFLFLPQAYVNADIISFIDPMRSVPASGRFFYFANPVTVGGQTLPRGIYIMSGFNNNNDFTFDPAKRWVPLARPTAGPYPDQFGDELVIDAATQNGSLNSGTFGGTSATRTRDLSIYRGVGGVHTMTHWAVNATKNGTQLTGTITYFIEQWILDPFDCIPVASANCVSKFAGTMKWEYTFTAVRVK